jgi:hypothetical protein
LKLEQATGFKLVLTNSGPQHAHGFAVILVGCDLEQFASFKPRTVRQVARTPADLTTVTPVRLIAIFDVHQRQPSSAVRADELNAVAGDRFNLVKARFHILILTEY